MYIMSMNNIVISNVDLLKRSTDCQFEKEKKLCFI